MNSSPAVLITNVHSSLNAGDLALLESACAQLRLVFKDPELIVSANWPEEPYFTGASFTTVASPWYLAGRTRGAGTAAQIARTLAGWLQARYHAAHPVPGGLRREGGRSWQSLFAAYHKADLVVGVSGNQFYSTGKFGWPMPVNALSVELAHMYGKPFYTLPQSIGPLKRGWERSLLRSIYGRARGVFFRENISVQLVQRIGIPPEKCHYAPDPAFAYPSAGRDQALALLSPYGYRPGEDSLGLTIIAPMGRSLQPDQVDRYYHSLAGLLVRLVRKLGLKVYIFDQVIGPTLQEDDRRATRRVLDLVGEPVNGIIWVNQTLTPGQLKACYGCMQVFIASRLHSGIFALGEGVPVLFINYLTKTRGVMEAAGLEDWVLDLAAIEENTLYDSVCAAWEARQRNALRLTQAVLPEIVAKVNQSVEWIARDNVAR